MEIEWKVQGEVDIGGNILSLAWRFIYNIDSYTFKVRIYTDKIRI